MIPADLSDNWPPPPRRRIYLLRHAEVEYFDATGRAFRPVTVPLTPEGQEQARVAGLALSSIPFDLALTSGLLRTEETARLVLTGRDVPIETEPRLREMETGKLSEWASPSAGSIRDIILCCLGTELTPETRFLAGESFGDCAARIEAAWRRLLARPGWRSVLVVAHGVVNRLLLGQILQMPLSAIGRLEQDACCINLIEIDEAGVPLVRITNFTAHDPGKQTLLLTTFEGLYQQFLRGRPSPR